MFDTRKIYNSTAVHHSPDTIKVDVNEHRAITDDSIRILSEMEEKMRQRVLAIVPVDENNLKGAVVYYSDQLNMNRINFHAKFILNGKEYTIEAPIDRFELKMETLKSGHFDQHKMILQKLVMEFSRVIACEVLGQSMGTVNKFLNNKF